jgi:adenine-specific DNA methylase
MKFSPVAEIFPLLEGKEFAALVESIRSEGQQKPIWILSTNNTIVAGRSRYCACLVAGVKPRFEKCTSRCLTDFIFENNADRKLTPTQRAMTAKKAERFYLKAFGTPNEINERKAAARAAKAAKAEPKYVAVLKTIEVEAPDLYGQIEAGELELNAKLLRKFSHEKSQTAINRKRNSQVSRRG